MSADNVCKCKLSTHADLDLLNAALFNKGTHRAIARRYSTPAFMINKTLVNRHAAACLGMTASSPQAKAAVKRRSVRASQNAEAAVEHIITRVPAPQIRTAEDVQLYNERLLAALGRRRIVAEARADDRLFVALVAKETELLAQIERNSGRIAAGVVFQNTLNLNVLNFRKMTDRELEAIVQGTDDITLAGAA